MNLKKYQRGDIIRFSLSSTVDREQQGDFRLCLVLSPANFNQLGTVLVAPIAQSGDFARIQGFTVSLRDSSTKTQGVILINGVRMLDLNSRKSNIVEVLDRTIVDEIIARLMTVLD